MKQRKTFLSLLLALALCLSLSIPALAGGSLYDIEILYRDGTLVGCYVDESASGDGWSYDSATQTLTLNGLDCKNVYFSAYSGNSDNWTLRLADGSVNKAEQLGLSTLSNGEHITITGTGSLILQGNKRSAVDFHLSGSDSSLTFQSPLTITGGPNDGDRLPLTGVKDGDYLVYQTADGEKARYAVIAPDGASVPEAPEQPSVNTAYATPCPILVNGQAVDFDAYMLKDANGNGTNYLKLRDVAHVLNGTAAQFNVGWDGAVGAITITTNAAYTTPNGSEMSTPFSGDQSYTDNQASVLVNGVKTDLHAITITDASGAGYTYFKLRDLGEALGFVVDWDGTSVVINTP